MTLEPSQLGGLIRLSGEGDLGAGNRVWRNGLVFLLKLGQAVQRPATTRLYLGTCNESCLRF